VKGTTFLALRTEYLIRHRPHIKQGIQQFFYCCLCIRCRRNVFTKSLPSNDRGNIQAYRQQGYLISLFLFFLNKESKIIQFNFLCIYVLSSTANNNNSIQFIFIYLRANLTAQRPITKLARVSSKKQQQYIYK
jgi:hypothetical protein